MVKTALISGAAQGIGRCIVRRFLERGYRVFVFDIDKQELEHLAHSHLKSYTDSGAFGTAICNLRNPDEIRQKVQQAAEFLDGRIDVLVNNGAIANPKWKDNATMEATETLEQWHAYIETNLTAPFVVSQSCIPYMKVSVASAVETAHESAGPCIIHIGSFRAQQSDANQEGYAATKAGLQGLTHSMAVSLQPHGIRVNLVAPGRVKAGHESKQGDEAGTEWVDLHEDKDVDDHPTNRAGRPDDIADAVEYMVNAGFVDGQVITVDGGAVVLK